MENISGANTFSGAVTIPTTASVIGNDDPANTLTLSNAAFTNTAGFDAVGAGPITISGVISGAGAMNEVGVGGVLNLTAVDIDGRASGDRREN